MSDVVRWIKKADGNWVWLTGSNHMLANHIVASVDAMDDGTWRARWIGNRHDYRYVLHGFERADDACLAAEKWWPPKGEWFVGWFESKKGGYFRKLDRMVEYVRQGESGAWYAVRDYGKLLAKDGRVSRFATAENACKAVDKERHTPVDLDPFAPARELWSWIKLPSALEDYAAELRSRRCVAA